MSNDVNRRKPAGPQAAGLTQDRDTTQETPDIMQFPMEFPVKIMGRRADEFADEIVRVVQRHAPDFNPSTLEMRTSSSANYLSLTATINATSRAQLDALYMDLTSHPLVKVAL